MSTCQCKSGFFSLRDCGEPSLGQCSTCQRAMCYEHSAVASKFSQCRDCWARTEQQTATTNPRANNANNTCDDDWAYSYRHQYYGNGYSPIYLGSHHSTYYDQYDTRSFNQRESEIDDGSDNTRAGFNDS